MTQNDIHILQGVSFTAPSYLMNILYINRITTTLLCNKMDTPQTFFYQTREDTIGQLEDMTKTYKTR